MSGLAKEQEIALLNRVKTGDKSSFEELYSVFWAQLFNQAYKRIQDEELVKEMIQDLFTELWHNRKSLNIHASVPAYLHSAMKYKIFNHYKSQIVREKYISHSSYLPPAKGEMADERTHYNELNVAFRHCISGLPNQPQKVYLLRFEENMSYAQIAKELHISVSTVEKHMIKALKILRHKLRIYLP